MWAVKLLALLVVAYAVIAPVVYVAQTSILFPRSMVGPAPPLPSAAERVALNTPGGERLHGVRIRPAVVAGGNLTTVLGFGGNAWNAEAMAGYLHELFPEADVIAFHYRGYPPSTGHPSASALKADSLLVHDFAVEGRKTGKVVAVGFSIGSGVAAHLARRRQLSGLILVTPFDSLEQLARQHYGWLPIGLLLRHHLSPVDDLRDVRTPVALISAEQDTIIPAARTAPLRKTIRNLILDRTIAGSGHNDIYMDPEFKRAMHQAMTLYEARSGASSDDDK